LNGITAIRLIRAVIIYGYEMTACTRIGAPISFFSPYE
jgi:hypothetical protein